MGWWSGTGSNRRPSLFSLRPSGCGDSAGAHRPEDDGPGVLDHAGCKAALGCGPATQVVDDHEIRFWREFRDRRHFMPSSGVGWPGPRQGLDLFLSDLLQVCLVVRFGVAGSAAEGARGCDQRVLPGGVADLMNPGSVSGQSRGIGDLVAERVRVASASAGTAAWITTKVAWRPSPAVRSPGSPNPDSVVLSLTPSGQVSRQAAELARQPAGHGRAGQRMPRRARPAPPR